MRRVNRKSMGKYDSIVKNSRLNGKKGKNSKKKLRTKRIRTKRTRTKRTRTKRTRTKRMRKKRTKMQVGGEIFNITKAFDGKKGILATNQMDVDKRTLMEADFGQKHCSVKWTNEDGWIDGIITPAGRRGYQRTFVFETFDHPITKIHFSLDDVLNDPHQRQLLDYEEHRAKKYGKDTRVTPPE